MAADGDGGALSREDIVKAGEIAWEKAMTLYADAGKTQGYGQGVAKSFVETIFGADAAADFEKEIEAIPENSNIPDKLSEMYEEMLKLG